METGDSKFSGIELKDVGHMPDDGEYPKEATVGSENRPKKVYPTLWTNTKDMPIDLTGLKAGNKIYLVAVCNISEIANRDRDGVTEPEPTRFELEIMQAGIKEAEASEQGDSASEEGAEGAEAGTKNVDEDLASTVQKYPSRIF